MGYSVLRYRNAILTMGLILLLASLPAGAASEEGPATASSVYREDYLAAYAIDGNEETRWASGKDGGGGEWLQIDFGEVTRVTNVDIFWERAYAETYTLEVSRDGQAWTAVHEQTGGQGGRESIGGLHAEGRFLRIVCGRPGSHGIYSIWEVAFPDSPCAEVLAARREEGRRRQRAAARSAREALQDRFENAGVDRVVFTTRPLYQDGHWYANISYYGPDVNRKTYASGGGLYVLNLKSGRVTPLLEDKEGTFRDPAVHYDGRRILFSWRKGGADPFHLYVINADGTGLRQLTHGAYDDIEAAWLPDGGIVFVSSRCRRWVNCWLTQVAVVHRCDADGRNIVPLSANIEHDNTPWPMPDGRILYMRWEYVDRSQVDYHHLWTMNPDGTGQMTYFGNMHPGSVYLDAKPVPGTREVVLIDSPGHGKREHAGRVALLSVNKGPDHKPSLRHISGDGFRDPYPISAEVFLAAKGRRLAALAPDGAETTLYTLDFGPRDAELHEPRPLVPRPRERVIPPRSDYAEETGRLILADVHEGRNMEGVARGDIKRLLVLEALPKPINYTGGMDPLTYGGSFTLERVLGTVPVEEDGSAFMELPANRALFFVALDKDHNSVKRMQSFLSVMPGETTSCVGCHEPRTSSVTNPRMPALKALESAAKRITPIKGIPDVFDFPRDIQPILDKHCVPCHDYTPHKGASAGPRAGGVILSGDHGPMFSHSYATLTVRKQFVDGRDAAVSNLAPRTIGTSASPLMKKIAGEHHGVRLTPRETGMVRYWIESGAAYPGTYGALGSGSIGGYIENKQVETDAEWPASQAASEAIERRCLSCHADMRSIPRTLCDENGLSFWRPDWDDPRLHRARHLVFNLTRPAYSLMLLAPLSKDAGGYGLCGAAGGVFASRGDPDYQKILAMCRAGKKRLAEIKRFDMPGFQPPGAYRREMMRYGVLPADWPEEQPIDPYETDRIYWASFGQGVMLEHPSYASTPKPNGRTLSSRGDL